MASNAISNLLAVFKTDASALPPPVRFVPASYLFIHAEPMPDGMQPSEFDGFCDVTLEGLAPIPLEQLAAGYMANTKSQHMLIFAAFRDRLIQDSLTVDDSFFHVLPSFYAAAPSDGGAHWVFLWEAGNITAVHYAAGETVPSRTEVEVVTEDTPAAAFAAREHLLKRLGANARLEAQSNILAKPEATRGSRDRLNFYFSSYSSAEAEPTRVEGHAPEGTAARWSADMRGSLFRGMEQRRRQSVMQSTRVLKFALLVCFFLLVGQVAWGVGKYLLTRDNTLMTSRKTEVENIQNRNDLLIKIKKFSDRQLHPFEMLGALNPYRPKTVTFNSVKVFAPDEKGKIVNRIQADCNATNADAMNTFMEQLKNSGMVTIDQSPHFQQIAFGAVKFSLSLIWNNAVPPVEATPPLPPPPAPDEPNPPLIPEIDPQAIGDQSPGPGPQPNNVPPPDAPPAPVADAPPPTPPPAPPPAPAPAPAPAEPAPPAPPPAVYISNGG